MHVGFTGTRHGLTGIQAQQLALWLGLHPVTVVRNGCCIGADDEFVRMIHPFAIVIGHPSNLDNLVSKRAVQLCEVLYDPSPPLERNRPIVEWSDILLACPRAMYEEQQSGTWWTVRYARKLGKPVLIFWPDGAKSNGSRPHSLSQRRLP